MAPPQIHKKFLRFKTSLKLLPLMRTDQRMRSSQSEKAHERRPKERMTLRSK